MEVKIQSQKEKKMIQVVGISFDVDAFQKSTSFWPLVFPDREGVERGWGRQGGGDPCRHDGQGCVPAAGLQEPLRGRLCLDAGGAPPHPRPR